MIYRIDVRTTAAADPVGEAVRQQVLAFGTGIGRIDTTRVFLIDTAAEVDAVARAAEGLLADPVVETADLLVGPPDDAGKSRIEIHLKPGVMDPVASSTEMALRDMGLDVREVRTGRAYLIDGALPRDELARIAQRVLANGVIESVHFDAFVPDRFEAGRPQPFALRHVPLRDLSDAQLTKLSRDGHLFLSLTEMRAVQAYFREQGREPTDAELETVAQTWSEHCVHKTLKSAVDVTEVDADGNPVGTRRYGNLIKETIFASTVELMRNRSTGVSPVRAKGSTAVSAADGAADVGRNQSVPPTADGHGRDAHATAEPFCLSVFKDNAGVIAFDDVDAVCFKVETHNHPSAIEPYGGSATGIGGCIRDILGTGLAAKPVANTDVFCVAYPDAGASIRNPHSEIRNVPKGVIHPKRVLQQVVAGVRDYGNRMGIPTVNGAVYFDDRYLGNPLVFCGCVGLIPRDKVEKAARPGDAIVLMGGRTGRDGIHGATFSSAELTDTHADEFSHAVQIGNAITQKKMADVILQARDRGLFGAITDLGAGGLSSAIGEMGEKTGAFVELDKVPLKYAGLRYDEVWISEAQERMALAVPPNRVKELLALARAEDVEATVIGSFGTDGRELVLHYKAQEVARIAMSFLHDGIPMPTRKAVVARRGMGVSPMLAMMPNNAVGGGRANEAAGQSTGSSAADAHGRDAHATVKSRLLATLAHPNVASKHWVVRQYDHEVQGGSAVKPLVGPMQIGPSDASVVRPKLTSMKGVAIGCGLTPSVADPYDMALAAIDEAVRNVVCVGADPDRTAILDNFCWPSVDDEQTMGTLVAACEACRDAALAYGIPFVSGKDSLHNQFTNSETGEVLRIPSTLLISAIGIVDDVRECVTMDFKRAGGAIAVVRPKAAGVGDTVLAARAALHRAMAETLAAGRVAACHDVSDGGTLTAVAEMCIASGLGADVDLSAAATDPFAEVVATYVVELTTDGPVPELLAAADVVVIGRVTDATTLVGDGGWSAGIDEMTKAWRGTLDW